VLTRKVFGAFVAAVIGVTVVALSTLLFASGRPHVPDRLANAPVLVQSRPANVSADLFVEGVPWSSATATGLAERLAAIDGVAAAVPDREFYAQVSRSDEWRGHGWSSAQFGGGRLDGSPPRGEGEVVLGRAFGLAPGATVTLLTARGPTSYTISGVIDGGGIYVADPVAARLAPGIRTIALMLRPGADVETVAEASRRIVGAGGQVLTGDARSAVEPRSDARTRWIGMQVLTMMAVLAGFVTVFIVASTFAFNVAQRRRELGLLRTIGATPRQIKRIVYREALAVGAAASVAGVLLGAALATPVGRLLVEAGFEPATFRVRLVAWPLVLSLAVGPVVALLGAWSAARRAARVRPLEALREAAVETRPMGRLRWLVGALAIAVGLAFAVGTATADSASSGAVYALYSAIALMIGAAVLAPAVVPPVVRVLTWPLRGAIGLLVRESALTAPRRTASTVAPILLTVGFAILISGFVRTSTEAYAVGRSTAINAGAVIAPDGAPGLSDAVVAGLPGAALLPTTVYTHEAKPVTALGVDPATFAAANGRLSVVSGALADLDGAAAVLTESAAAELTGPLRLTFADGEVVQLRVVAVVTDRSAPARLLLPRALVREHDGSALTSAVFVPAAPGAVAGARVLDVATYAAEQDAAEDRLVWLATLLLIGVSAGYGAIAVANTLLMAAVNRKPDVRVLRLSGATGRQVMRTMAAEASLVVAIGALLGAAVAVVGLVSIRAGLSEQVRAPVDLVVPWSTVLTVLALCLVLAVAASVLPLGGPVRGARPPRDG
jgi:putative ABC transport system permease protein